MMSTAKPDKPLFKYSKTPIYRAPIYRKPRFTAPKNVPPILRNFSATPVNEPVIFCKLESQIVFPASCKLAMFINLRVCPI